MVTRSGYVSRIPQCILNDSSLSDKSYHLFLAMLHAIDPEINELQMSMPELQVLSRMSESTVRRHLRDLVERGYLIMQRPAQGKHIPTTYRLPESLLQDSLVEIAGVPQRQVSERTESDNSGSAPAQSGTRAQRNMLTRIRLIRKHGGNRQVSGFGQDPETMPDAAARQVSARYARTRARACLKALKSVVVFRFININIYKTEFKANANTGLDSRAREAGRALTPDTYAAISFDAAAAWTPGITAPAVAAAPAPAPYAAAYAAARTSEIVAPAAASTPAPYAAARTSETVAPAAASTLAPYAAARTSETVAPAAAPAPAPYAATQTPEMAAPAAASCADMIDEFPPHLRVPGMAPHVMHALLAQYGELRVAIVVQALYNQTTTIRNAAGWVISALRNNWDFNASIEAKKSSKHDSTPQPSIQRQFKSEEERMIWEQNVKAASIMGRYWRDFETGFDTEAFMRKYRPDLVDPAPVKDGRDYVTGRYSDIIEH